jgi:hypothetical protein
MNVLELRNRIREISLQVGLSYSEVSGLYDVNELLNQQMPCLIFNYQGNSNDYTKNSTRYTLDIFIASNFYEEVKRESKQYQRDWIVTENYKLRLLYIKFIELLQIDEEDYITLISDQEIVVPELLGIESFLFINYRIVIETKREYCV